MWAGTCTFQTSVGRSVLKMVLLFSHHNNTVFPITSAYDDKFPYKDRIKNLKEYFMSKPDLFAQVGNVACRERWKTDP